MPPRLPKEQTLSGAYEGLRTEYDAARESRLRRRRPGVTGTGRSADWHYRSQVDYLKLIELARDTHRNDPIAGQLLERVSDNVVQDGFTLDPDTKDKGLDQELRDRWYEWAENPLLCDKARESTFQEKEKLISLAMDIDGDCFELPCRDGSLESVEAHRCRTPGNTVKQVICGVKLGPHRERQEYWFTPNDIDPWMPLDKVGDIVKYPAYDKEGMRTVFHILTRKRSSQTRGITALAPIFDMLGIGGDLLFAALIRSQIANCIAFIRQRGALYAGDGSVAATGPVTTRTNADGSTMQSEEIYPGMQLVAGQDETIQGFSPGVASPDTERVMNLVLSIVGANVGAPLNMVLLDPTKANFSSLRGNFEQAKFGFRQKQRRMREKFHTPCYLWKVRQWCYDDPTMEQFRTRGDIKLFNHLWHAPAWPYLDPLKDAGADLMILSNGLSSPRRIHAEAGRDWADVCDEIAKDNVMAMEIAIAASKALFERTGERVDWREIMPLPKPGSLKFNLAVESDAPENDAASKPTSDAGAA